MTIGVFSILCSDCIFYDYATGGKFIKFIFSINVIFAAIKEMLACSWLLKVCVLSFCFLNELLLYK